MCLNRTIRFCVLPIIIAAGCANVNPRIDYDRTAESIAAATGHHDVFRPDDEEIDVRVAELEKDGITEDEAVRICLLNNPTLQAAFYSVGIACADVVQSGLFSNPTLAFSVQLPEGGGRSNIQSSLAQNIVDLWQIPVRKRAAERSLDVEILSLARHASQLVADTKSAYYAAVAAESTLEVARSNAQLATQLLEAAQARQQAGAVGELDVNLTRGTAISSDLDVKQSRLAAASAKRKLATLLGLAQEGDTLTLTSPLPSTPVTTVQTETVIQVARRSRLDLLAAQQEVEATRQRITQAYQAIFPSITIGPALERNEARALGGRKIFADTARASVANGQLTAPEIQSRGERDMISDEEISAIFGPAMSLTLPLFDQNQAQIAKAKYLYEQALKRYVAIDRAIVQEASQAVDQASTAWDVARYYEESVLPQAQSNLDLSRESYRLGRTSLIVLLDAQRFLLTAKRAAVEARQAAAVALTELERSTSRPITSLLSSTERSTTTQPSSL